MKNGTLLRTVVGTAIAATLLTAGAIAVAQSAPKAATAAPKVKRTAEGKPDFNGAWTRGGVMGVPGAGIATISDGRGICVNGCGATAVNSKAAVVAPAEAKLRNSSPFPKYKPEFADKVTKLSKEQVNTDPALRCANPGLPRIGPPKKIIQTKDQVVFLYDDLNGAFWRIIPTDGRRHRDDAEENFFGDSVGHWEGDKLVVETTSFSDVSWLTDNGAFHTSNLKIVEELTTDGASVDYTITATDPEVLAEPWVKSARVRPMGFEPFEPPPCVEQSISRMSGTESYHANPRW